MVEPGFLNPVDTRRKVNLHKTFNLRPVSTGKVALRGKCPKMEGFFGSYFPVFGLNKVIYSVFGHLDKCIMSLRIPLFR